jgi:hypothetical protein
MIGRYTMGARGGTLRLREWKLRRRVALRALAAGDDFEDFEFLAVGDGVRDGDRRLAAHDDDGVGADALGAQHFFDGVAFGKRAPRDGFKGP